MNADEMIEQTAENIGRIAHAISEGMINDHDITPLFVASKSILSKMGKTTDGNPELMTPPIRYCNVCGQAMEMNE